MFSVCSSANDILTLSFARLYMWRMSSSTSASYVKCILFAQLHVAFCAVKLLSTLTSCHLQLHAGSAFHCRCMQCRLKDRHRASQTALDFLD